MSPAANAAFSLNFRHVWPCLSRRYLPVRFHTLCGISSQILHHSLRNSARATPSAIVRNRGGIAGTSVHINWR